MDGTVKDRALLVCCANLIDVYLRLVLLGISLLGTDQLAS